MSDKTRLRKGEAKIQIIACQERINRLLIAGYGPVLIHETLTNEGLITMTYSGFYEAFRYGEIRKKRRKKYVEQQSGEQQVDQATGIAPAVPIDEALADNSSPKNAGWSLDDKLAALDKDGTRAIRRKRSASADSDYNESEVL